MRTKIIEKANEWEYEFNDLEIDIIIQNNCKCCNCSKSIFELSDFPEVLEEEREVL